MSELRDDAIKMVARYEHAVADLISFAQTLECILRDSGQQYSADKLKAILTERADAGRALTDFCHKNAAAIAFESIAKSAAAMKGGGAPS